MAGSALWEWQHIWDEGALQLVKQRPLLFALSGGLGFAVNILSLWVIRLASSLSLKVLGTVKNTILVVIGATLLGEIVTVMQARRCLTLNPPSPSARVPSSAAPPHVPLPTSPPRCAGDGLRRDDGRLCLVPGCVRATLCSRTPMPDQAGI
mmetsp:Transcript_27491/g.65139  ORF Transcript_27491/g.65139 Transcript_27491/m.65139 type:complete len:151 (+) Transcript_27491:358-810(+)